MRTDYYTSVGLGFYEDLDEAICSLLRFYYRAEESYTERIEILESFYSDYFKREPYPLCVKDSKEVNPEDHSDDSLPVAEERLGKAIVNMINHLRSFIIPNGLGRFYAADRIEDLNNFRLSLTQQLLVSERMSNLNSKLQGEENV